MPTGDSDTAAPQTVLTLDARGPSLVVELAAAVRAGVREVRLTGDVLLTPDEPRTTLAVIRLLRETVAQGIPVDWHGAVDSGIEVALLVHLGPPASTPGTPDSPAVEQWRQRHQPGLCYYRLGPGFVFVKDVRRPGAGARFRLEGVVDAFSRLEEVVDVQRLDPVTAGLVEDLQHESLVLRLGNLATLLPSRMRRWPVPALEV